MQARIAASVFALCQVAAGPLAAQQGAIRATSIEPLILFKDDRLASCGVRAVFGAPPASDVIDIVLRREDETAQWIVSIKGPGRTSNAERLVDLGVKTATHDTRASFSKPVAVSPDAFEVRGTLAGLDGSTFIQEIMVQGATIGIVDAKGAAQNFAFAGPLPQTVRVNYLMCAGDLFH